MRTFQRSLRAPSPKPSGRTVKPKSNDEPTAVRFGRYMAIQSLGAGGMATVYLALRRDASPTEPSLVALKQSHGEISRTEQWKDALREAQCGTSIAHPNVVRVFEVEDGAQGPYIVMEYIEGGSLLHLLTEGMVGGTASRIPVAIACRIVVDTLRGLHAAHEARDVSGNPLGLIHRDVSPHNVIVGTDGVARLADFGIARLMQLSGTGSGLVRGKAGYISPEQAAAVNIDRRSDLFSMGVVLWEALSGRRLFKGESVDDTLARIQTHAAPSIKAMVAEVPEAVAEVCDRLLSKPPHKRPQSALEVANVLEAGARAAGQWPTRANVAEEVRRRLHSKLERRRFLLAEWCMATGYSVAFEPVRAPAPSGPSLSFGGASIPVSFAGETGAPLLVRPELSMSAVSEPHGGPNEATFPPDADDTQVDLPVPRRSVWPVVFAVLAIAAAWACGYISANPSRALKILSSPPSAVPPLPTK